MSGLIKHLFRGGDIQLKSTKIATNARTFKEIYRPGLIMSSAAFTAPDSEDSTGALTWTAGGGALSLTGLITPLPNKEFNASLHLDRLTMCVSLAGVAKMTRLRILSIAPTSGTLATLYDDTDERTVTTDPTGELDYDCDCDIPDGYAIMVEPYFTVDATADFVIYSIIAEYSLV